MYIYCVYPIVVLIVFNGDLCDVCAYTVTVFNIARILEKLD